VDARCKHRILAGGVAPDAPIAVGDDLTIALGTTVLLGEANRFAGQLPPLASRAKRGRRPRVTATDAPVPCHPPGPLCLRRATGGGPRRPTGGVAEECSGAPAGVFCNKRFAI
jgi:hypothetical protein